MTPPRASLVGLPREICDKIYSYLRYSPTVPSPTCVTKRNIIIPAQCTRAKDPLSLDCMGFLLFM